MKCEICHRNEGVISVENIQRNKSTKMLICPTCAISMMGLQMGASQIFGMLQGMNKSNPENLNNNSNINQKIAAFQVDSKDFICPNCNTNYDDIEKTGTVGCPDCFFSFHSFLDSIIYKNGLILPYKGTFPIRLQKRINLRNKIVALQSELDDLVKIEDFEKAAVIRDKIKKEKRKYRKIFDF